MKLKTIITVALLAFVAASIVYIVVAETRGKAPLDTVAPDTGRGAQVAVPSQETRGASGEAVQGGNPPASASTVPEAKTRVPSQPEREPGEEARKNPPPDTVGSPVAREVQTPLIPQETKPTAKVVAYYFHGSVRCMTCRTIEAYAKEAIETEFPDALKDGRLEWRVVNVEEPGNDHFVEDFQLTTRSVVLERLSDGRRLDWKNLDRVWELVRGDKDGFLVYIQDETTAFLKAAII